MITQLRIKNYRCFEDHTVTFKDTAIIVGPNNAGKSTIIEALRLVSIITNRFRCIGFFETLQIGWNFRRYVRSITVSSKESNSTS